MNLPTLHLEQAPCEECRADRFVHVLSPFPVLGAFCLACYVRGTALEARREVASAIRSGADALERLQPTVALAFALARVRGPVLSSLGKLESWTVETARAWSGTIAGCGCTEDDADLCTEGIAFGCNCDCHIGRGARASSWRAAA